MIASTAVPLPENTPPSFLEVYRTDRQLARHRNAHFSSSALLSQNGSDHVVLGTTLGDLYTLNLSILGSLGQQELSSVIHTSVEAHSKVISLSSVSVPGAPQAVASSGPDSTIKLWRRDSDAATPASPLQEIVNISVPKPSADDLSLQRAPNAECLSAASEAHHLRAGTTAGTVLTYDVAAPGGPAPHSSHSAHAVAITGLASHPTDPHLFATASADGTAAVWDARAAEHGGCVARVCPCAPASTGATIAPTADAYRSFWRNASTEPAVDALECCEFDQSGRWLVLGCADGTLRYFSLLSHEVTGTLQLSSAPQALCRNGPDLFIGCARGELYAGGFIAEDVASFQEHVVAGRPRLTSVVAQNSASKRAAGQAGMVVACGTPGTVLGMHALLRMPLCTVRSRLPA